MGRIPLPSMHSLLLTKENLQTRICMDAEISKYEIQREQTRERLIFNRVFVRKQG
jgi:hypothetical protein